MKRSTEKKTKVVRGVPSAVVLSILIHAALFLLAGMLVVFTVVKKEEQKFVPPKAVDRPKMKLKKPKVKVKKSAKPKQTTRIVTKMNRASMPDIQIPEMSGMGGGLNEGFGGFDLMPDLDGVTVFGSVLTVGNDFVGTFYDLKRDQGGRGIFSMDPGVFATTLRKFVRAGWKAADLSRYYRSTRNLYATTFTVPSVLSVLAPEAFGEPDTVGYCWMAHYKGLLVCPASHTNGIAFRFWGAGDNVLVVRVDGKVVLSACNGGWGEPTIADPWQSRSADTFKYTMGHEQAVVGDWITLEPGLPLDMEVMLGESLGGAFCAVLAVEERGVEYPKGPRGNPILPIFKTAAPSLDLVETIHADLFPDQVCVTNGPVFCDYDTSVHMVADQKVDPDLPKPALPKEGGVRTWTLLNGKTMDAEFVTVMSGKAVLKDARGRSRKVPLNQLSDEDRLFAELARPPKFNFDFSKKTSQRIFESSPYGSQLPKEVEYVFSARLKQTSAGEYRHELKVEFFAIGEEIDGDNYILFDRQESRFTPSAENERSHTFSGRTVPVRERGEALSMGRRGDKYGGYLVVVTDTRGKVVDIGSSHKWMPGLVDELRRLPIGKHFDKSGGRVAPPRPKAREMYW